MGQKRFINRISPFELIKSDALLGGPPRQPTTIGKLVSHHGERHHEAERELGISEQKHHRPALLNNNEGESRLLCFCLYIARGDTKNNGYLDDLRSLTIVAGRKPAVFLLFPLHLTTRSSQKGAFRLAERKMILSLSFVLPFLLFHTIPSSVAAPCNGTTTGIKSCQPVTAGQLSCTFLVPLRSVTGTAPVSIIVKGLASSSIVVTTASATSTGAGCGSSGITIAGPTYLADSSAGVNNIALFTMPVPATPADVEVTVTAVFNSVGATSSDAVGVWVNDRLLVSWSATTVSTPISDVCSPSNWTTIASTCSDLTVGFFEPVVCTFVIPVLVTKAKTVYDVQLKLLTPAPDVRFERAALTATLGNNCTNATVPKHEIKKINTAVTYSSSSYWYDTSVLRINFYGDFATSAQLAYKLQVDFFVSQINSLMPPSTPVLSLAVISNDGVSTNQTVSIPSTTIVPTSAYLSCNQRGLYYLDWTTCKSVYVATTSGSLRLLLNTSFDIQIEDAQVPQFYCTDCGITLPTVTITNFVSSRSTGYVDVTWTMGGGITPLYVVVDISISSVVKQYSLGTNGTLTVDRIITGNSMTTETVNLTLVGFPMTNNATEIKVVDKSGGVIANRMSFFEVEFGLPLGFNEHLTLGAQQGNNASSEWIIFTAVNVRWESTVKLIDKSSYFDSINRTGSSKNSILVDLGRVATYGNSSQAIITVTFYAIAQTAAVNQKLDLIFLARSDDLATFGSTGHTYAVVGTTPSEDAMTDPTDYPTAATVNVTTLNPKIQVGEVVRVDAYLQFNVANGETLQKFQYKTGPSIVATFKNQAAGHFTVESVSTADVGANIPCYTNPDRTVSFTSLTPSGTDAVLTTPAGCFVWRDSSVAAKTLRISALMRRVVNPSAYSSTSATITVDITVGTKVLAQQSVSLTLTPNTQYDNGIVYNPQSPMILRPSFYFSLNQTYTPVSVGPFVYNLAVFIGSATTSTRLEFESASSILSINSFPFSNKTKTMAKGANLFGSLLPSTVFASGTKLIVDLDAVTLYPMKKASAAGSLDANVVQLAIAVQINPICNGSTNFTARLVENGTLQEMAWNMTPTAGGNSTHLTSTLADVNAASYKLYNASDTITFQLHFGHAADSFLQSNWIKIVVTYPTALQFVSIINQTSTNGMLFNTTIKGNTLILSLTTNSILNLADTYDGFLIFKVLPVAEDFPAGNFQNYTAIVASQIFYQPCPALIIDPTVWPAGSAMAFSKVFVKTTAVPYNILPISNCQVAAVSCVTGSDIKNGNAYATNSTLSLWSPIPYADIEQWYQFFFGQQTIVSRIQINTNAASRGPVGNIRLDYQPYTSSDPWRTAYTFTINATYWTTSATLSVTLTLPTYIQCASIRIVYHDTLITKSNFLSAFPVAMNFYVYGKQSVQNATCIQNATLSPDVLIRAYLPVNNYLFICNDQSLYDNSTKCYRSDTANSKTWTALAPYVRNVIKYDSSTTNLYGLHRDKVTYLVSNDYGLSWTISTQAECDSATGTKHASPPPTGTNTIPSTTWSTDVDGVYYSGSLVLSWANFCF